MKILESYFSIKRWKLFSGIILANLLLLWLSQTLINETVFFNTYSDQLTYERSMELFARMKSFSWTAYLFTPLLLLIKFSVLTLVIYIGVFFSDMQKEITLDKVFTVVIASEVIILFASAAKLLWFSFFAGNYTLDEMGFFYPLSLINLFNQSEVDAYWVYPLQLVNIFQLVYILMLAAGLSKISAARREVTDRIILSTYFPAIALWIVLIMFITINASA
ncbi:MAG TPA: hypothetical protein VMV74_08155 [Bacteroidales bacterium]|nr:hypothetical protein [Bacteroidales bacterium]